MTAFQKSSSGRWKAIIRREGYQPMIATFDTKSEARG